MLKVSDFFGELKLRRDSHVADFGCGVGDNVKFLSELVPDGKVFAIDVHKDLLEHIETDIKKEKRKQEKKNLEQEEGSILENISYQNIVPVWGDIEEPDGTRLRDDSIDAVLISNVFFLLKHKKVCIMEIKRVLKKYGKVLFIDWHKPLGTSVTHKQAVVREDDVIQMFKEAGFMVQPRIHKDEYHYVMLAEKK